MIDLNLLNENPIEVTMMFSGVLSLKNKRKTVLPVLFPIDYYFEDLNIHSDEEQNLLAMMKQTSVIYGSANGLYFVGLCTNGDLKLYEVNTHILYSIKGLPLFSTQSSRGVKSINHLECIISNDGNLILFKILKEISSPETRIDEDIWLWVHKNSSQSNSKDSNSKNGTWIRCGFDSLSNPLHQNLSNFGESINFDKSSSMLSPKKNDTGSSPMHALSTPESVKFAYSFDAKFIVEDYNEGTIVKMVQAKLYKVKDYYSTAMDANLASATAKVDHIKVLELEAMNYKLDLVKKGGNSILSDYSPDGFKRHV